VDDVAWITTDKDVEEVTAKLEACASAAGKWAQANAVSFDEGKTEAVLFGRAGRRCQLGKSRSATTRWPTTMRQRGDAVTGGVTRQLRKARQATPSHRSVWADTKPLPNNPGRVRPSKCPLWLGAAVENGRRVKVQANDIQLMVNRQARSTTGCYKSINSGALAAEAGLRPATSLLDNRQRRFALGHAGLPSSEMERAL